MGRIGLHGAPVASPRESIRVRGLYLLEPLNDSLQGVSLAAVVIPEPKGWVMHLTGAATRTTEPVNRQITVPTMMFVLCGVAGIRRAAIAILRFKIDIDHILHGGLPGA
jgi:hypothetical protein